MRTLLIDNYDSYTFNLFHLLGEVNGGEEPIVVRNDELPWSELAALAPDNIVISPGPGRPEHARDAGVALEVLRRAEVPVLGVCLGHQELAYVFGGTVEHAREVMHGRLSPIHHDGRGLFAGLPQDFLAVRYHSLVAGAVPPALRATAWTPGRRDHGRSSTATARCSACSSIPSRSAPGTAAPCWRTSATSRPAAHGAAPRALPPPRSRRAPAPPASTQLRRRRARGLVRARGRLQELYAGHDHVAWLDSSRAGAGVARFSFIGAPDGPLGQVVRYDVAAREVVVERAVRPRGASPGSVLDHCRRELARLRADAPELPFDFVGGFVGYLGFELKAECGGRVAHASPLPDAALLLCDRVIAFDHRERRIHLLALAAAGGDGGGRRVARRDGAAARPARARPAAASAGARPARHAALRASRRRARGLPGEHRRLPARDPRGRELRDLPDDGAAQRRGRSIRCPPTGRCARATPPRSPRCCGWASCPC